MRRWLIPVAVLLVIAICQVIPDPAGATGEKAPLYFSGVETMLFRNGESPTPDYDGIRFWGMRSDSTSSTLGDGAGAADSFIWLGDVSEADDLYRAVFRADISAIPDSAIVVEALLYLLREETNALANDVRGIAMYRLLRAFDDEVCWTNRRAETATDTAWGTAGMIPASAATGPNWPAYGALTYKVYAPLNEYRTTATGLPTVAGKPLAMGADSLYSGYSQTSTGPQDALMVADLVFPGRWIFQSTVAWARFDVTALVRHWHSGQWANHGMALAMESHDEADDYWVKFHAAWPETTASGGVSRLRPFLVVKYVHCYWP